MNCRKSWHKIYHLALNLLLYCVVKIECSAVQLYRRLFNVKEMENRLLGRPEPPFRTVLYSARDVFFRHAFSETPQPIALKLWHMIRIWLYFIN